MGFVWFSNYKTARHIAPCSVVHYYLLCSMVTLFSKRCDLCGLVNTLPYSHQISNLALAPLLVSFTKTLSFAKNIYGDTFWIDLVTSSITCTKRYGLKKTKLRCSEIGFKCSKLKVKPLSWAFKNYKSEKIQSLIRYLLIWVVKIKVQTVGHWWLWN